MKTNNNILISKFSNESIPELIRGFNDYYYSPKPELILKEMIDKYSKYASIVVARIEGEIVGYCSYYKNNVDLDYAFLSMIVIKRKFRRQGIASQLMEYTINDCKLSGFRNIRLRVNKKNTMAISWYERIGYVFENDENSEISFYNLSINAA